MKDPSLWEVQWHPAGGGAVRRLVLTWRGLRWAMIALAFVGLLGLVIVGALPVGLQGFLTRFTVDAAQHENKTLRDQQETLREQVCRLAFVLHERVQRGRKVAWALGAPPPVWEGACPAPPAEPAGPNSGGGWLAEQGARLDVLGSELAAGRGALRCPLPSLPLAPPVDRQRAVPVALFGWRLSPFTGKTMAQYGTTLAAPQGEPVVAPGGGRVLFAGSVHERRANEWTRFGNLVALDHGGGVMTVFAHLRDVLVKRGQTVARGQRLGSIGQTGWTRVPALYYEVRWPVGDGSRPIDPGLVTATLPVENLDARLADPTGDLPGGYAALGHLTSVRADRRPPQTRPVR